MAEERRKVEELTIKFGKGFAEPFTGKNGREYMRISIPNRDPDDKNPWASFVLPAKAVHENQYGKGLWAKIPADGETTVTWPERHEGADGKVVWEDRKVAVPNNVLKDMVEAYRGREKSSVLDDLGRKKTEASARAPAAGTRKRETAMAR